MNTASWSRRDGAALTALLLMPIVYLPMRVPSDPQWRFALGFHLLLFAGLAFFWHPALRPQRLATWWDCVTRGSTTQLRDLLALTPEQGVIGFASHSPVADRRAPACR